MKFHITFLLLLGLIASSTITHADSVILKDGTEIKGEIISDGPDGVLIEYFVSSTIKDQKSFTRSEVEKVVTVTADERAFLALGSLETPPTLLDTTLHDNLIDRKLGTFVKSYPYSTHLAALRERLRVLEEERTRLRGGDCRIDGVWVTAAQIAEDPYQTGARVRFSEMKAAALGNEPVKALQSYELMEKNTPGASVMPESLALALTEIAQLQSDLLLAKANFEVTDKVRQKAIAIPGEQAKILKDAMIKEDLASKAAMKASLADGTKFFPIFSDNKEALDALQVVITAEKARLTLLQSASQMNESLTATKEAARLVSSRNIKEAGEQLATAEKLWPANAEIASLRHRIEELSKIPAVPAATTATP